MTDERLAISDERWLLLSTQEHELSFYSYLTQNPQNSRIFPYCGAIAGTITQLRA